MIAYYLMVGGFLGAGKTTALLKAAAYLTGRGRRVGLIMNDQSDALVDTALVRAQAFPVEEIAGGCFCCRFNTLTDAAAKLTAESRPDVFLAEPVGSCTDLAATVALPLRHLYADQYRVAPLSVLVDPDRALRVLGVESGRAFSPKVEYIYAKQLEEADVLVINKIDRLSPERLALLRSTLEERFPSARIVAISARSGDGVAPWIDGLLDDTPAGRVLDIDYDTYAEGESLLGWLNCTARLAGAPVDADQFLKGLATTIHADLAADGIEIAHLKLTLVPPDGQGIAVVNATRTDRDPELAFSLDADVDEAEITVNLRAEADPERLEHAVRNAANASGDGRATLTIDHLERFRPGRPVPTHRMVGTT
jgi:Ni2+-binding GTPase involved in maturation of urease and hydrogenase